MFPSNERLPTIPRCACGSDRVFEVQLLPTLLSFVNLEDETLDLAQLKDDKEWSSISSTLVLIIVTIKKRL